MGEWALGVGLTLCGLAGAGLGIAGKRSTKWHRRILEHYTPWVSTACISVLGTLSIALVGLVVEDFLPQGSTEAVFTTNWLRVYAGVIALVLLVVAIVGRTVRERKHGTLYYIRLQPEGQPDWHLAAVKTTQRKHLDYRSATDTFSIDTAATNPAVIDLRRQVDHISTEIERTTNDDRHDSGQTFAPNVVAPAALALGYDWLAPVEANLRDFNKFGNKPYDFEFTINQDPDAAGSGRVQLSDRDDDQPSGPIHLYVHLSLDAVSEQSVFGVTAVRTVGLRDNDGNLVPAKVDKDDLALHPVIPGAEGAAGIPINEVSIDVAKAIRTVLADTTGPVILEIRAPKTVMFAIGWYLANLTLDNGKAQFPWQRIVPVASLEPKGGDRRYYPMWVRYDQTNPAELLR